MTTFSVEITPALLGQQLDALAGAASFTPEQFASAKPSGVCGDGTDDGPALDAMSAAVRVANGGIVDFYPGRTYWVGGQTLHNPGVDINGAPGGVWAFFPNTPYPVNIYGCIGPLNIRMNGATIKSLPGGKYGAFNADGTPHGTPGTYAAYAGYGASSPYLTMMRIVANSGGLRLEGPGLLDGNIASAVIGGPWAPGGDGIQLPMTGLILQDNTGPIEVDGPIFSHRHGSDGCIGDGPGLLTTPENVTIRKLICLNNGRQGISAVGGNGWTWEDCEGSGTGKNIGATMVASQPAAGMDLEAEGGKYVVNTVLIRPRHVDNSGATILADSSTNTFNIDIFNPLLVGTTNYAGWFGRPGIRIYGGTIVGAVVHLFADPDPSKAFYAYRTKFTNDPALSPTGATFFGITDISAQDNTNVTFDECDFDKRGNTDIGVGALPANPPVGPFYINCSFHSPNDVLGHFNVYGIFIGERTSLVNVQTFPGTPADAAVWGGTDNRGLATDSFTWSYPLTVAGLAPPATVATRYKPTFDRTAQKKLYYGSATYDPPSLAAAAKDTIKTMTVTGVAVGDFIIAQSFSVDLAGARIVAWVSAADTVSYYAINENGANPLDLASGTFKVTVRQA